MELFVYEISYTDNRMGDIRWAEIVAQDEGEASDIAFNEDYYFGKLVSIDLFREANKEEIEEYMRS